MYRRSNAVYMIYLKGSIIMKKKLFAALLVVSLVMSVAALSVSATANSATCDFNTEFSSYNSGLLARASGTKIGDNGYSAYFCPNIGGGLGGDTVGSHEVNLGADGSHLSNGTRRLKLLPLSNSVPAGNYEISIWVADPNGLMTATGADFGALLTFHSASVTDSSLLLDWNDSSKSNGVAKIFDVNDTDLSKDLKGNHFGAYTGSKTHLKATTNTNDKWVEYKGTIKLTKETSQIGIWLYMWSGYTNVAPTNTNFHVYFDNLTIKATSEAPDTLDVTSVVIAAGAVALAGVVFATKKKHA